MKVNIRKYSSYPGSYATVCKLFWWAESWDKHGLPEKPDWVVRLADGYADTWIGRGHDWLAQLYTDWQEGRRVNVHIDPWDSWSADHTLAHIILPVLVDLKRSKQGAPNVDAEDVPENMRPGKLEMEQYNKDGTTDALFFKRWDWVLDEMIWAFSEHVKDHDEAEGKFWSGTHDIVWTPVDKDGNEVAEADSKYSRMDRGPNDTSEWDREGWQAYMDRKQNGFRLFGKYYTALWT
mgnify:CR=1 FL=1